MKTIFTVFSILISVFVFSDSAKACSCSVTPPVSIAFQLSPNVVILKVKSVEKYKDGDKGYGYGGIKQSLLTVEKSFKGTLKVGQELTFTQGGGSDCIWTFDENSVGDEYLFYLGEKPIDNKSSENVIAATGQFPINVANNVWIASTCSRSDSVKYRHGDLKYIKSIEKVKGKTRLSGMIYQDFESLTENENSGFKNLANKVIQIRGNGKNIQLKTDENGFYEIYDLLSGKYSLSVEKIEGYKLGWTNDRNIFEVNIKPISHTELNLTYRIDNSISGKFLDANGKILKDVCIHLIPANGQQGKYLGDCTNEKGEFKIDEIPLGKHVMIINEDNEISADEPFGSFYYPNVLKIEDAKIFDIKAGEHIKNLLVTAPTTAETIIVSGILLYSDGKPVSKKTLEFHKNINSFKQIKGFRFPDSNSSTDKDGKFSLRILKGDTGVIFSSIYIGDLDGCPNIKKIPKSELLILGNYLEYIYTNSFAIDGGSVLKGITLKFPFPSCKKAKID